MSRMRPMLYALAGVTGVLLFGCPEPTPPPDPIAPMQYEETYTEVRDCRQSGDHDLNMVRVLADPGGLAAYTERMEPFPVGAILVKEQYEFGDADCSGPIVSWTIMRRLAEDSAPLDLDWEWQTLDQDFLVDTEAELYRCPDCHMGCDPPSGYMGTCTEP